MVNRIILTFLLLLSVPLYANAATVVLPKTGQEFCYDPAANAAVNIGVIPCAGTGQDGATQIGAAWPIPRFTNNSSAGVVVDNLTGLTWLRDARCALINPVAGNDWTTALTLVKALRSGQCGLADASVAGTWRLPNVNELQSLVDISQNPALPAGNPFINFSFASPEYWSSTITAVFPTNAEGVNIASGVVRGDLRTNLKNIWPVKGTSTEIPRTGQNSCWALDGTPGVPCLGNGADGDLKNGAVWPIPRFVNNADGTLTDNLTGLIWLQKADCFGPTATQLAALTGANTLVTGSCALTDGSVAGDWRLPNRNEMRSLISYEQTDGATWLTSQGFLNPSGGWYWASDSYPFVPFTNVKWMIKSEGGTWLSSTVATDAPTDLKLMLPVRGPLKIQPITFNAATVILGAAPLDLTTLATGGGSGIPLTFTLVSGPGALSGTGNQILTPSGPGSVVITASQAGDGTTFLPATNKTQTITVAAADHSLTFLSGGNGTLTGTTSQTVAFGASATSVTAVPATGYHFVNWTDSGTFTSTANPLTLTNVTADQTLTANFAIDTFLVTGSVSGGNGTLSCTSPVNFGANCVCTASPDAGYHLQVLTDNGTDQMSSVSGNTFTITNVTGVHDISAGFARPTGILNQVAGKTAPDLTDALAVLKIVLHLSPGTPLDTARADIAPLGTDGKPLGDGTLDVYDVIGILRMMLGLL